MASQKEDAERINPDVELLIRRAAHLTFGIFGTIGTQELEVREGGSGIFVAPFLAITARHVTKDLYRLEGREAPRQPHQSQHDAHLFQVLDPFSPEASAKALWRVDRSWVSSHTDIALLQVSAENDVAKSLQAEMPSRFFEWRLSPPPTGATVLAIGYPQHSAKPDGKAVDIGAPFVVQKFRVTRIHSLQRDKGMMNFPCFEVDDSVDHGFSGGPVLYGDRLCGIVSSGSGFDRRSHIASLWPLTLMDYSNELDRQTRFGDLLDSKVVVAEDWPEFGRCISKGVDGFGEPYLTIDTTEA